MMKPLGDGFIKLIRMMIAPVIFLTVVTGIARIGDMRKLGRVGLKALLYFEVVTTIALFVGFVVVKVVQPGAGINATAATLDAGAVQQYATSGKQLHAVDFLLHMIPDTLAGAFANGEILQVLLIAILFGVALAAYPQRQPLVEAADSLTHLTFEVIALIMKVAPIGAFGAMAFTIGKFGLRTLLPLGKLLLCVYLTSALFVFVVLGLIARFHGFSLWKLLKYFKEELLLVLGTSSSEVALPRIIVKLERLGCSKSVVGLVVPSGYLAVAQPDHPLGLFCDVGLVGDQDHRASFLIQTRKDPQDVLGGTRVEVAGRLIGENQRGVGHERARDRSPLLLAARQLRRHMVHPVCHPYRAKCVFGAPPALGTPQPGVG